MSYKVNRATKRVRHSHGVVYLVKEEYIYSRAKRVILASLSYHCKVSISASRIITSVTHPYT